MYVEIAQTCSKCNSTDSENFSTRNITGIRCRKCGHEKINSVFTESIAGSIKGVFTASERNEF